MVKHILYSAIVVLFLFSCNSNSVYEKNQPIVGRTWTYETKPHFDMHIEDKNAKYNLYINLRHSNEYDYSNIFVLLHEKGNGLKDTAYRKEIPLAQRDGRWFGNSAGSLYEITYLAKEKFTFPDTGIYTFAIEQNMRDNPLKGIVDIGIKIIKE